MTIPETDLEPAPPDVVEESPFERPAIDRAEPMPFFAAAAAAVETVASGFAPMAVVGDGTFERPKFGLGVLDTSQAAHPFDGFCKVCQSAEPARETKLDAPWRNMDKQAADGRWLFRGFLPVNCCEACYEEAKRDTATEEERRRFWLMRCPVEFRDDWDNSKGDPRIFNRVMDFNPAKGRGLLVHGPTTAGKTRAVWRLLRKLSDEGIAWLFIEAIDLMDSFPNQAFTVPILVIDDMGNDALTSQKEVRLLKLLRTRANWHRPIIITTQFDGAALEKRFSETATARAVIRRLREFCDDVYARPNDKKPAPA